MLLAASWLKGRKVCSQEHISFQRLCRLLRGYQFNFVISKPGSNTVLIVTLHSTCAMHERVEQSS